MPEERQGLGTGDPQIPIHHPSSWLWDESWAQGVPMDGRERALGFKVELTHPVHGLRSSVHEPGGPPVPAGPFSRSRGVRGSGLHPPRGPHPAAFIRSRAPSGWWDQQGAASAALGAPPGAGPGRPPPRGCVYTTEGSGRAGGRPPPTSTQDALLAPSLYSFFKKEIQIS